MSHTCTLLAAVRTHLLGLTPPGLIGHMKREELLTALYFNRKEEGFMLTVLHMCLMSLHAMPIISSIVNGIV